jgi:5'-AMP-activated protein kinase, regulatory gamma subunit
MPAAPLWDAALCQFVGLFTITDFIDILRYYRQTNTPVATLATRSIAELLNDPHMPKPSDFLSADTSTSLKQACLLLHRNGLDFLPIVFPEDMRVVATVTYTTMLEHLVTHFHEQRRLFDDLISDLQIGTYRDDLVTIGPHETIATALELLHCHNLSALPVVDGDGKLIGVYSRSDVTFLATAADAQDALSNMDVTTVGDICCSSGTSTQQQQLKDRGTTTTTMDLTTPDAMHTCRGDHTLQFIFEYFAQWKFNRLYVVDDKECVVGVVSARDLVAYFLEE